VQGDWGVVDRDQSRDKEVVIRTIKMGRIGVLDNWRK